MPVTEGKSQVDPSPSSSTQAEGTITAENLAEVPQPAQSASDGLVVVDEMKAGSNVEIAREVLASYWGRGNRRRKRLIDAGYDPDEVQKEIDKIINR